MLRLAILAVLVAPAAWAQSGNAQLKQAADQLGSVPDAIGLTPAELLLQLIPTDLAQDANAVVLVQNGTDNDARIEQLGVGNRFALVQEGNANWVDARITGDVNDNLVQQSGDGNEYLLEMTTSGEQLPVLQLGSDNQARQFVEPGLQPAGIIQIGNGMEITVERTRP